LITDTVFGRVAATINLWIEEENLNRLHLFLHDSAEAFVGGFKYLDCDQYDWKAYRFGSFAQKGINVNISGINV
jgi:hypothetical protein